MVLVTPIYYAPCPLQKVYVTTKDFGCYAFVVFDNFTSYIHIQVAHMHLPFPRCCPPHLHCED